MHENSLWCEKYRPKKLEEYVWRDDVLKAKVEQWLRERCAPHVLFSGRPGVGKTTLAHLVLSMIGIPSQDILFIPASRERKIDDIIDKIGNFVQTWAWNDTEFKYVILDEADSISLAAQKALRADLERYEHNTRFFFTCNHPERIHEAIMSRVEHYVFNALDYETFELRLVEVMIAENIQMDEKSVGVMQQIASKSYPDLRKSIGLLQQNCLEVDGKRTIQSPKAAETTTNQRYLLQAADLIFAGKLKEARTIIVNSASTEDYPDIYRWMYQNLPLWGKTETQQDEALLAIRRGLVHHSVVADVELNLSATLIELKMIWQNAPS